MSCLVRILPVFTLVLILGCTPEAPNKEWTGVVRILPIIVTSANNESLWSEDQLTKGFKDANDLWSEIGIQFSVLDSERLNSDKLYDQTNLADFLRTMSISRGIAQERHLYPVYFVNSLRWGDNEFAGISTSADAPLGFQYGTVISAITRTNSGRIIAHELGHAWNLRHSWSDKHSDTPGTDSSDCNDLIHCNVMSYCFYNDCPPPPLFSLEQIEEARAWALSSSRFHLLKSDISVKQVVLPLLTDFEPILDSAEVFKE